MRSPQARSVEGGARPGRLSYASRWYLSVLWSLRDLHSRMFTSSRPLIPVAVDVSLLLAGGKQDELPEDVAILVFDIPTETFEVVPTLPS